MSTFHLRTGKRKNDAPSSGIRILESRARIVLVGVFAALSLPIVLDLCGIADYDSQRSADDPVRPADRSAAERVCIVSEWMSPACMLVWVAVRFRTQYSPLFRQKVFRIAP